MMPTNWKKKKKERKDMLEVAQNRTFFIFFF